jgi:membrane peptidoglycan carboxypeptidase
VGVTPIQLVTAVSAIANGGLLYKPHVVQELRRGEQMLPAESAVGPAEPKRVIRPETAATLRRMMEGVVLNGTGVFARLEGWTAAGKTGTAQKIDPETGRYSRTQLIASFTGFAPINNPAVTILVSLDSPVGLHEGMTVAAPVFKRIAEQVLPYLGVPRDVPVNRRLLEASYKKAGNVSETASLDDFTPTDLSNQLQQVADTVKRAAPAESNGKAPLVTAAVDEGGEILVPDFAGKTMREVTELCLRLGLEPVLVGSSLAVEQTPAAGAKVRHGAKITVEFAVGTPKARKTH